MHAGKTTEPTESFVRIHSIRKIQKRLLEWGSKNYFDFPWRSTNNKFHALVAEIMLQRTRAEQVVPVYLKFVKKYDVPDKVNKEKSESIIKLLKPLGLNWRAQGILQLSEVLSKKGNIPTSYPELIKLPSVGPYVANAFLSFHLDKKKPIIDSNAVRLWSRIYGFSAGAETRRKKFFIELAEKVTPDNSFKSFNYALLDFSRSVCKKNPSCNECFITRFCAYFQSTSNK